jgi:2-dehydropantoate 2-reductase
MLVIYGAGAVGLVVGARLARAGLPVLLVTRRPEAARRIDEAGVRIEDPSTGRAFEQRVAAVCGIEAAAKRIEAGPVLFCMRSSDTAAAARALAAVAREATVASLQNDVDNEERLSAEFPRVVGGSVRQTSTRTAENAVVAVGRGRIVIGLWPSGDAPAVHELADALRRADYDVGLSTQIAEDKWLKLCVNLMSAPNALIRREDHATRAFVEIKARLLEEARAILLAAGISARSCDGRDRSLDQEIAHQRESLAAGTSAHSLPVYNQVWAALGYGGPVEADRYHRRMLELAAAHGIPAPQNARVLEALERAMREALGPESLAAADLLAPAREPT